MYSQCAMCVFLVASLAAAAPQNYPFGQPAQTYQATGVLEPESADLGSNERIVAATIDILPELAEVFERIGVDGFSDGERGQKAMLEFLPLTRKLLKAKADAEGTEVRKEDLQRVNAAEAVMPAVNDFVNRLRKLNVYGSSDAQQ
ncbi:uncharacterized protein [Procambarus clarkii]|uniref:uncharacterized protein isoform X1 n=1 Tax=Procambarus clarkii TaxID=6728 RepID=UPI001E6721ED|nr:uncharacterized protein LOC123767114 isoform X1 [Procambarus clarkii]